MPDYIRNRLTITCKDGKLKNKIKNLIFRNNENNEEIFSMTQLLPVPDGFSKNPGYTEYEEIRVANTHCSQINDNTPHIIKGALSRRQILRAF